MHTKKHPHHSKRSEITSYETLILWNLIYDNKNKTENKNPSPSSSRMNPKSCPCLPLFVPLSGAHNLTSKPFLVFLHFLSCWKFSKTQAMKKKLCRRRDAGKTIKQPPISGDRCPTVSRDGTPDYLLVGVQGLIRTSATSSHAIGFGVGTAGPRH